jgi:hypothetical protein
MPPLPGRYLKDRVGDVAGKGRAGEGRAPRLGRFEPRWRRRLRWLLVIPALVAAYLAWSLVGAATTVGNQSFNAKWADWLRSHHAAVVVNHLEDWWYSLHAPRKGGRPKALNPLPAGTPEQSRNQPAQSSKATTATPVAPAHLPPPAPVPLVVSPALPGEGQWQPVGPLVGGIPAMYEAQFRADTVYTSEITTAVWIDPLLARISLIPGLTEPGGAWPQQPPYITNAELPKAVAAFNGGFRFQDAHGGFYLDGRTAVPLRDGAASIVLYSNGSVNVGTWGSQVGMSPGVVGVLQNLVLMVDGGQVAPSVSYNDNSVWGATLGAAVVVPRSGVGVTADGALVYVAGPALTARTLAEALQRAGAVRAMALDINPEWVTFNFYSHPDPADPAQVVASKLYPQMQRPATRYLGPTEESRDFFLVSLR